MTDLAITSILMVLALILIGLIGLRAVSGVHSAFYRISAVCLAVGLNFNTTERVTGDVMSEFGSFMLFAGFFVGAVLVAVDSYAAFVRRAKRRGDPHTQGASSVL